MAGYILLIAGIVLLIKSADYLVEGASSLADRIGVSSLIIGLTIVSIGTSFPELVVNIIAALKGSPDIAFGNVIGSCMANTCLILGVMALFASLKFKSSTIWKEIPFSFLAVFILFVFSMASLLDNNAGRNSLSRTDGVILLLFFSIFLYYIFNLAKKDKAFVKQSEEKPVRKHSSIAVSLMIAGGLAGLFAGGKASVEGAVRIAEALGLSEYLISAAIIAVGTSLPELMTSVVAALKKNADLAVGNIVGSNIFNMLFVLGVTSLIKPIEFPAQVRIDIAVLLSATFLLFLFMFTSQKHKIDRWEGIVFVLIYIGYMVFIISRG
jgi:cation:H+ antiporter